MLRFLRIALCLILLAASAPCAHASQDIAAVVSKVQAAYADMQSFRADFTQELFQRDMLFTLCSGNAVGGFRSEEHTSELQSL